MSLPPAIADDFELLRSADLPSRSRLKLDLVTSYALSAARVGSNIAVFSILYRYTNERYAAAYALIRSMLMLLTYLFGGFSPVLQRLQASSGASKPGIAVAHRVDAGPSVSGRPLDYASGTYPISRQAEPRSVLYFNTMLLCTLTALASAYVLVLYAERIDQIHSLSVPKTREIQGFAYAFAGGMLCRLVGEPASAVLQARRLLWSDNLIMLLGEAAWVIHSVLGISNHYAYTLESIGIAFLVSGMATLAFRIILSMLAIRFDWRALFQIQPALMKWLLGSVALISLGQFADFLYAPANVLLINRFIDPSAVARYAPALQIDAGLLLLVGAVSSVMLPRAMSAWARGDHHLLRAAYIRSTLACLIVLTAAAILVALLIEPILQLWLGTIPLDTPMITRLVLIHTVIGGTAGVGRAVLLGMGRFKAYTVSALLGGVANVALALLFVLVFEFGLRGIVFATILSVAVRCAIWMPWYILRALGESTTPAPVST